MVGDINWPSDKDERTLVLFVNFIVIHEINIECSLKSKTLRVMIRTVLMQKIAS